MRTLVAAAMIGGLVLGVAPYSANAAQLPSAIAQESAPLTMSMFVVPGASSRTVSLPQRPANATSVKLQFSAAGAWRDTQVRAALGPSGSPATVLTAKSIGTQTGSVSLPMSSSNNGQVTVWSGSASVRITVIATYTVPGPVALTSGAMPGPTNTGVPVGKTLRVHTGDMIITQAGAIIDGWDIRGRAIVRAANVTIKNSIIRGPAGGFTGPSFLVGTYGNANVIVTDSELAPSVPNSYANGIVGNNYTLDRVNIHHVIDSTNILGDNVTIKNSWLHDNLYYAQDPNWNGRPSHPDSIQIQNGSNVTVDRNTISGARNAVVMVTQDRGRVANLRFTNNFADGGGCSINIAEKSYGAVNGVIINDNKFGRHTTVVDCAVIAPPATTVLIRQARNYYVPDGRLVSIHRG